MTPDACAELKVSDVKIEVYMDGRRPDLVATVGSEQYWVEIANKHKCDGDKIWHCRSNNKNVIEIDVSECGHLDKFNSLKHCLVRTQSLNVCNDYLDDIASHTTKKHETVRKQFEALMRSQKLLEEKESKQENAKKTLEERIEEHQKKYEDRLEKMKVRESSQDEILAELEKAIESHKTLLDSAKSRHAQIESEIVGKVESRLKQLDEENQLVIAQLREKSETEWKQELESRHVELEKELADEFNRRFQREIVVMEERQRAHEKLAQEFKVLQREKFLLCDEIESLGLRKKAVLEQQRHELRESFAPLIEQRNILTDEVTELTKQVKEKLIEADLVDTYANNLIEVRDFCLARTDYRQTINKRMNELKSIERQSRELALNYEQKFERLDVMVKISNEFVKAFKTTFDLLQKKDLLSELPEALVKRINKHSLMLSRNAQEELDDLERMEV
ncbi:hypothetical protein [Vibrio tapetis]|uniref:Uncharacterized protein n=1 Tax=Vibrio tapetis subsp. tapetis TaxID=1671868 RepID=A0A2N8ZAP8_9VIBR|nr:hypothetical protein [Vibrio tapetis]SON48978.1 conserved protein of unknown function [Vibrio tapetis subsp. tapetis]